MQNPYAHSTGPAAATPEAQRASDYETAIGPNADHYLAKFEGFDQGGSKLGWHWPAFFVTTPWFLYRKMWGWGMGNLAYFWGILTIVAPIAVGIAAGTAQKGAEMKAMGTVGVILGTFLLLPTILLPMFANALYWRHISKLIDNVPSSVAQQPDKRAARITRSGGTGAGAMIGVLAGGFFLFIAIVGILAAIAIPAYQDYTIRAQITEGLNLATAPKAAVAEYYAQNDAWPADSAAVGVDAISGKYVESLKVENGSIVIVYGGAANQNIAGKTLILLPGSTESKDVVWTCAGAAKPAGVASAPGPFGADVPNKYLPRQCRSS
jgi:type IV pilus assembly protein PilA